MAHWEKELSEQTADIKRLQARNPNDRDLPGHRQDKNIAELELEAWRIVRSKTDTKEAAKYLEDQLKEVMGRINDFKNGTPGASDHGSTTASSSF